MEEKIEIIDINNEDNLLDETYEILNKKLEIIEQLNEKTKELELLKIEYNKLLEENKKTNKIEDNKKIEELTEEIKEIKEENIKLKKNILMIKTLIKIIFKEYGMNSILNTTKLSLEQIKKYLN